tara:strand:- start:233 stop:937 length:705 start_codon:yes stop_codon:yes gene_type:complete
MNKNFDDGLKVIKAIRKKIKNKSNKKYIVLPPLQSTLYIKNNIIKNDVIFGSQDCSQFKNGAFTGDISAEMIKKIGCKYVLIGHSERRTIFNESDEVLKTKMKRALEQRLKIIFCVGESLTQYKQGKSIQFIIKQLTNVFDNTINFKNIILAYEPIWAIGTNITPKMKEIDYIHCKIKETMKRDFNTKKIPILYGGSVKATNSADIFSLKNVDGGLIGGASLIASEFCKIYDTL